MQTDYQPIPVEAAKAVAITHHKSQVVIIGWDPVHKVFHTATYGFDARDKVIAAKMGEILTRHAGGEVEKAEFNEDFRKDFDAAKYQQARKLLHSALCVLSAHAVGHQTQTAIETFLKP